MYRFQATSKHVVPVAWSAFFVYLPYLARSAVKKNCSIILLSILISVPKTPIEAFDSYIKKQQKRLVYIGQF
jgi:hypothetical protein